MLRRSSCRLCALAVVFFILFSSVSLPVQAADPQDTLSFTPEEEAFIASQEPLKVGYVVDRIPVSFTGSNGELAGISRYIFDRLSELTGLKFEYVPLPAGDVTYEYLLGEGFDLVTSVEYNKENQAARGILISDPYLSSRKVVVAREELQFRYDANLSIAISTGSQTLRKVLGESYPNFDLVDYPSISACFDAVNDGDADLMIQNQYVVEYWISKPSYEKLKVVPVLGLDDQICFSAVVAFGEYDGPSSEDGRMLIDILNKGIANITEDEIGTYTIQAIMENQYTYTLSDFCYRYRLPMALLAVFLIVILLLMILISRQRIRLAQNRADAKTKGEFLSTMSHEIRTPLNGLIGLNHLMSQKLDEPERLQDYLLQSTVTANYLLTLVNDILDMSKLEDKKLELVHHPVELDLMISTVSSIVETAMAEKGLNYTVSSELTWPCIQGDEVRIQQVILNLLDNARKFTPAGGRVELSIRQEETEKRQILTTVVVTDTGCGISEDFQKRIFDAFAQDLTTVSKGNQGTGLGLPISRRLALLMGGDLTFVTQVGKGSAFTFTFLADPAPRPPKETKDTSAPHGEHPRILVAEDNELNGEIIMELLSDGGFEAELAENGKKALERFSASAPGAFGVILMDLLMPEMDGYEATQAIRALDRPDAKTVRILACTANCSPADQERALASGMDDFIAKPVNVKELFKKING